MIDPTPAGTSHQMCQDAGRHVCQKPSGRTCIEPDCSKDAGTRWGPYWCPDCDKRRLDRISASMETLLATPTDGVPLDHAPRNYSEARALLDGRERTEADR